MTQLFQKILILILISNLTPAGMMAPTRNGEFGVPENKKLTYVKAKQVWLFWGILPLGRTSVATPSDGNCEIITKRNAVDVLVTFLTVGIVTTHSIKVIAKKK